MMLPYFFLLAAVAALLLMAPVPSLTTRKRQGTQTVTSPTEVTHSDGNISILESRELPTDGRWLPVPSKFERRDLISPIDWLFSPATCSLTLLLVLFSALRFNVGQDYQLYSRIYERLEPRYWEEYLTESPQEIGFTWLQLFVKSVSDSPYGVFWIGAILCVVPAVIAIARSSEDPSYSILLFVLLGYYLASMNIIRQSIAMGIMLLALSFLLTKPRWFVAAVLTATLFHYSAVLVALTFLIARNLRPTPRILLAIISGGVVISLLLTTTPPGLALIETINPRYGEYAGEAESAGVGTYANLIVRIALLALALWLMRGQRVSTLTQVSVVLMACSIPIIVGGFGVVPALRLELYFSIVSVVALANLTKNHPHKLLVRSILTTFCVVYYFAYLGAFGGLLPYETYL